EALIIVMRHDHSVHLLAAVERAAKGPRQAFPAERLVDPHLLKNFERAAGEHDGAADVAHLQILFQKDRCDTVASQVDGGEKADRAGPDDHHRRAGPARVHVRRAAKRMDLVFVENRRAGFSGGDVHRFRLRVNVPFAGQLSRGRDLFAYGLARSLQFTTLGTPAYADVTDAQKGPASTLWSVAQQMTMRGLRAAREAPSAAAGGSKPLRARPCSGPQHRRWPVSVHQPQLTINKNNSLCCILISNSLNRPHAARECLAGWHRPAPSGRPSRRRAEGPRGGRHNAGTCTRSAQHCIRGTVSVALRVKGSVCPCRLARR